MRTAVGKASAVGCSSRQAGSGRHHTAAADTTSRSRQPGRPAVQPGSQPASHKPPTQPTHRGRSRGEAAPGIQGWARCAAPPPACSTTQQQHLVELSASRQAGGLRGGQGSTAVQRRRGIRQSLPPWPHPKPRTATCKRQQHCCTHPPALVGLALIVLAHHGLTHALPHINFICRISKEGFGGREGERRTGCEGGGARNEAAASAGMLGQGRGLRCCRLTTRRLAGDRSKTQGGNLARPTDSQAGRQGCAPRARIAASASSRRL